MSSQTMALPSYIKKLYGKRVLVFGGSGGIGFAVACAAYENGAKVIISSSSNEKIARAVERIRTGYPSAPSPSSIEGMSCNLSDRVQIESNLKFLFDGAVKLVGGPLDHIAYTAGDAPAIKPIVETSIENIENAGLVRFVVPFLIAKLIMSHPNHYLSASPDSSLTLTSGSAANKPFDGPVNRPTITGYWAGVEGATRSLAKEMRPIRVNCVSPGVIRTDAFAARANETIEATFRDQTLVGRLGRPEDIADTYLAFMRDGFLTGDVIHSSGGRLLE